jgi:hypothetical protein
MTLGTAEDPRLTGHPYPYTQPSNARLPTIASLPGNIEYCGKLFEPRSLPGDTVADE